jgi:Tfp pilus assembly protein PilN
MAIEYKPSTGESVKKILGVNYSTKSMHAAVVECGFKTIKQIESISFDLPDNKEEKGKYIIDIFKKWKHDYNPKGIVIGIASPFVSYQFIDMPPMNSADMKNALHFELEKYLPLPVEEYIYDFILPTAKANDIKTLAASVKRDIVSDLLAYAKEADIPIMAIRADALVAVSQVLHIEKEKRINGMLINCTAEYNEIIGLTDSMPVFYRRLSIDRDLSGEIERFKEKRPGIVYVNGTIDAAIMERFKSRTVHISTAQALAITGSVKSHLSVNFLPPEHLSRGSDYYTYMLGGFAVGAVILFFLTGIVSYAKNAATLSSLKTEIATLQSDAADILNAHKKLNDVKEHRRVLLDFQGKSNVPIRILSNLSEVLSDDVWLVKMQIDEGGKIEMEGFAKNSSSLIVSLEESAAFKNVAFSSPIIKRSGEERFSLKMEVEDFGKK